MTPTYVEGMPWPQGDPHALRAIAKHAGRLAIELTMHHVFFDFDGDWKGAAQDAYALQAAEHDHAIHSGADTMLAAGDALTVLAAAVEAGQHAVRSAAADVARVRDVATTVADRARGLRERADQQNTITTILSAGLPPAAVPPSADELAARQAESDALKARFDALDLQTERRKSGQAAFDEVQRADQVCAARLEALHLVQPAGSSPLGPGAPALSVLGSVLLGKGAGSDTTLITLLSTPPPLPEPPKKPEHHHFWMLAGLAIGALVLTAANAVQLGLDPATDALEAADVAEMAHLLYDAAEAGDHIDEHEYEKAEEAAKKRAEQLAEAGVDSPGSVAARDALMLAKRGDVDGPLRPADGKDPRERGADFVDVNENLWRHEVAPSAPGGFDAARYVTTLQSTDLANNRRVMLNYDGLTSDQLKALLHEIDARGVGSQFRFIPPL